MTAATHAPAKRAKRAPKATPIMVRPTGAARPRLSGWNLVIAAGAAFAIVLMIANVVVYVGRTGTPALCPEGQVCVPPADAAGQIGARWTSPALKYSFEYPVLSVQVDKNRETPADVHLTMPDEDYGPDIWITGYAVSTKSADAAFRQRLADLKQQIPDLAPVDDGSYDRIPAPSLGFVDGVGGAFSGNSRLQQPARVAIVAVSVGRVTVVLSFTLTGAGLNARTDQGVLSRGSTLIADTFRFS